MIRVNLRTAKARLSRLVDHVLKGGRVQICRRNVPVAEIRALLPVPTGKTRSMGLCADRCHVPPSFFDPLPDEVIESFENPS